jgi:transposase-like protein
MMEALAASFPGAEYRRCLVHQVRNTLKYVGGKDKKEFANGLKKIYHAPDEQAGRGRMLDTARKWEKSCPNAMKSWSAN